jgi:hypothetical protein
MTFSHSLGLYNVEGTLNNWFNTNLTANGIPAWMPSARVVYDYPENGLINGHSGHAFSVTHQGAEVLERYQGNNTVGNSAGQMMQGMAEINCWISKEAAGASWPARLRQMGDMVRFVFVSARQIEINNLYTSTAAPSGVGGLITFGQTDEVSVAPDPNPDIMRRRFITRYRWVEQV